MKSRIQAMMKVQPDHAQKQIPQERSIAGILAVAISTPPTILKYGKR
jgi:hypothetical protein